MACSSRGARSEVPVVDLQGGGVVGDGGAQDGDVRRGGVGRLKGSGGVGQDQIHVLRQKAVNDGGAVGGVAGGVALGEFHIGLAQFFHQRVLKALGGGVQRGMLILLTDADEIGLAIAGGFGGLGFRGAAVGRGGALGIAAGAGAQGQDHGQRQEQRGQLEQAFHSEFLQFVRTSESLYCFVPSKRRGKKASLPAHGCQYTALTR